MGAAYDPDLVDVELRSNGDVNPKVLVILTFMVDIAPS